MGEHTTDQDQQYCQFCGQMLPDDANVCHRCGGDLNAWPSPDTEEAYCPICGNSIQPDYRACPSCGQEITHADHTTKEASSMDDSTSMSEGGWTIGRKVTGASAVLTGIGAFLPWVTVNVLGTSASLRGIEADGKITFVAAVLVLISCGVGWKRWHRGLSFVFGVLIAGLGAIYINDPLAGARDQLTQTQLQFENLYTPGVGLYLTAIGGALIIGGVIYDTWIDDNQ